MKTVILLTLSFFMAKSHVVEPKETFLNDNFAALLYKEALKDHKNNFVISTFSVQTILALLNSGTVGISGGEIRDVLGISENGEDNAETFADVLTPNTSDKYALRSANKVYVKSGLQLKHNFKVLAEKFYAWVENIDFSKTAETAKSINDWVKKETGDKIQNLLDESVLDSKTEVLLINAMYFKGTWVTPFHTDLTKKSDFYKTAKDVVQVDTMNLIDTFNYCESTELNAKLLQLPFQGDDVSMVIVLPNEKEGLADIESKFSHLLDFDVKFTQERVSVSLPKFTIESKIQLKKNLQSLGVKCIFDPACADLSRIAGKKGNLVVQDVVQKAFINVTEAGTEASAATYLRVIPLKGGLGLAPKTFNVDRPFIFSLYHKYGAIIVGRVTLPNIKA